MVVAEVEHIVVDQQAAMAVADQEEEPYPMWIRNQLSNNKCWGGCVFNQ
jgi:hypothetical protein